MNLMDCVIIAVGSLLIKSQGENEVNFRTDFEYNK